MHGFDQLFDLIEVRGMSMKEVADMFEFIISLFLCLINVLFLILGRPDLNPLDYSIWSLLEADVNAEEHNSVESLKNAISEAFERLPMEVINQAVDNWMKRLDAVIKAKGGHFE